MGEADGERKRKGAVNNVEKARKSCTGKPDTSSRRPFFLIIDTRPHSLWAATNILSATNFPSISSSLLPSIVTQPTSSDIVHDFDGVHAVIAVV